MTARFDPRSGDLRLTGDIGPYTGAFLELEGQASEAYTRFVFSDVEQARTVRDFLFQRGLSEFSPPYGQVAVEGDDVLGMIAYLDAHDAQRMRLRAAFALAQAEFLRGDPELQARIRLAGSTLLKPRKGDLYLSRIATDPSARGRGVGRFLMTHFETEARNRGCERLVLEVSASQPIARNFYRQLKFEEIAECRAVDAESSRSLEYVHMAKRLE